MSGGAPFELKIGRRYLRSSGNRFLSFISLMSMVGVAIGVAVTGVAMSRQQKLRDRDAQMALAANQQMIDSLKKG